MVKFKILVTTFLISVVSMCVCAQPTIQWSKTYGGHGSDVGFSIFQTSDGGYVVGGNTQSLDGDALGNHGGVDYWVLKLSPSGVIQWKHEYGGKGDEVLYSCRQTRDGGYILAGSTDSTSGDVTGTHGNTRTDFWIVKISDTGAIEWEKAYGSTGGDFPRDVKQTYDGGYIVAGFSDSATGDVTLNHGDFDYWVLKLSSTGAIEWQKSFGGTGDDKAYSVLQTPDSGYLVGGETNSTNGDVVGNHGIYDMWVLKLSPAGSIQWQKCLGGSQADDGTNLIPTLDGNYLAVGVTHSTDGDLATDTATGPWFVKLSPAGSILWQKIINVNPWPIYTMPDGGYLISSETASSGHGMDDGSLIKLSSSGTIEWEGVYGGSQYDGFGALAFTTDGGCVVAGATKSTDGDITTGSHGDYDLWVLKLNSVTGVQNVPSNHPVILYPNPTSGTIYVNGSDFGELRVYNSIGEQLKTTDKDILSISELPQGMYIARVFDRQGLLISTNKIVRE